MLSSLLTGSTDATRVWLRAEMDRTVDPMLYSIFSRLTTKLTNGLEQTQSGGDGDFAQVENRNHDQSAIFQIHQPSTSSHFNPQIVNMNYSCQQQNGTNHLNSIISKQQQCSQSQHMTIKEEIEPMHPSQVQSSSYAPASNEQSNHNLTDQHSNNDDWQNSQINLPNTKMQPQLFARIKHIQFDDEECDCDECIDGGMEVKEEDEDDDDDQVDEESSRPVKRPRLDTTQPNNAQAEVTRQSPRISTDETQLNEDTRHDEESDRMGSEQSDDESMVILQEESDANNAIGEEAISSECTTNPIQANLAQPNRHLQCSHCLKSFDRNSKLQAHLRVHTGERPFHCDLCDKHFKERGTLARHRFTHQNIKRFQCHECEKQFALKHQLDAHLRTHFGVRPFACRHCEKKFTELGARKCHEQAIHLHVKPYRCKQCGHTATHQSALITHIRVVHFGLPPTIKQQRARNIVDERDPKELVEKI